MSSKAVAAGSAQARVEQRWRAKQAARLVERRAAVKKQSNKQEGNDHD